jgi:hypothetical protein
MQGIAFVGDERLTGEWARQIHFGAEAGTADSVGVPADAVFGATATLPGCSLNGTLCGAKNNGPFCPQAGKPDKTSKSGATVMIRREENIS